MVPVFLIILSYVHQFNGILILGIFSDSLKSRNCNHYFFCHLLHLSSVQCNYFIRFPRTVQALLPIGNAPLPAAVPGLAVL